MNDDLHDLFRGMADEAPSDDGLLEGVHAAYARAQVRRRVLVSSAAALAVALAGVGVLSATRSDAPRVRDQVSGASGEPTAPATSRPSPAPSVQPSAGAVPPPAGPTLFQGRAVSADGTPVAGLYVYALPQGFPQVEAFHNWLSDNEPVTRTRADGTFAVPCPSGPVLLASWPFNRAQDESTPNWAAVFVGGVTAPSDSTVPRCRDTVQTTEIAEGAVIQGTVSGPGLLCPRSEYLVSAFGSDRDSIYSLVLSNAWTHEAADGAFQLAGLPVGSYQVEAFDSAPGEEGVNSGYALTHVEVTGPGLYQVELAPTRDDEDSVCSVPSPTETPGPDSTSTPAPSPSP